ncbi:DHA2 family efflux MFS transporter permease subunit [Pseudonocardia alaniniphila]|uniref:DHA2 family efflux MFS transporter permease subunit n=1 Tax=Pseudonocardia alaniniphila TaxID=75291 RepID=A0ABS9TQV7_9PSEU|nr:DHA2 family efflux MFS transporter permease subunit [Pseudonocardia alaniniphila]MCH6170930.1 DHA2 family efflux MFS transporter permease subunit [Pseudonocardia alaniniphila]
MTSPSDVLIRESSPSDEPVAVSSRGCAVITVLLVSTFVVILNETIMGVALPVLLTDLHVDASVGQWLTAGFLLTMSVVIPITGFLIRRVPTRLLYGIAMTLFSAGTLIAALAPDFPVLLIARVVQASGTAILFPLLTTIVMKLVPPARRGTVMGYISIVVSVATAVGPTVSGVVLSLLDWRFMFWLVLPIAIIALVLGLRRIFDIREPGRTPIDAPSVVLSALGFGGLVYGLSIIGGESGRTSPVIVWMSFAVGVACLVIFIARQLVLQRTDSALLDLRTFRSRTFTVATALMMLMMAIFLGTVVLLPIYMQKVLMLPPLSTGLLLLPGGLLMGLLGPVVGRLYSRFGARALVVPGAIATSGALWTTTLFSPESPIMLVVGFHLLLSVGLAFVTTPLFTAGLGAVPPRLYSYGSAIFGTTQQLAGAAGVALLVSVLGLRSADLAAGRAPVVEQTAGGVHAAFVVAACLSLIMVACAFFVPRATASVRARQERSVAEREPVRSGDAALRRPRRTGTAPACPLAAAAVRAVTDLRTILRPGRDVQHACQ